MNNPNIVIIYPLNTNNGRYSAFKIKYVDFGIFDIFHDFSEYFVVNFWSIVVSGYVTNDFYQFGNLNCWKYSIFSPITPKNVKKTQFFNTETSKWNLTLFRPPPPSKIFHYQTALSPSFHLRCSKCNLEEELFCYSLFSVGGAKAWISSKNVKYDTHFPIFTIFHVY